MKSQEQDWESAPVFGNMSTFPKVDCCRLCQRKIPRQWIPAVLVDAKPLAGTGVWQRQVEDGRCFDCLTALEARRRKEQQAFISRIKLLQLLGGEKPLREFTFERYKVAAGNRLAWERCKAFGPSMSLYVWGPCGVGKTHLAYAAARNAFEQGRSVILIPAYQISRRVRLKGAEQEQAIIDEWIHADVLVLDDLGMGADTPYSRQILQEVLDGRVLTDRAGLLVASKYSLDALARKLGDDAIPSRLAAFCSVVGVHTPDYRLKRANLHTSKRSESHPSTDCQ